MFGGLKKLRARVSYTFLLATVVVCGQLDAAPVLQSFDNAKKCQKTDSCSLKKFQLQSEDKRFRLWEFDEEHIVSTMVAQYETDTVEHLEDYVIVQFMRGCRFDSRLENGKVNKTRNWGGINSFGRLVEYRFPEWTIDSSDSDPVYNSEDGISDRHYLYRWNTVFGSFDNFTHKLYGQEKPQRPSLYVKDRLSSVFLNNSEFVEFFGTATNHSIQFRTCIYKAKDVPRVVKPTEIHFATPIQCFEWASSLIYNHGKEKFESPKGFDPYCISESKVK